MAVIFDSRIKINPDGNWFIVLTDTVDNRVVVCHDLDEYSKKVEELGADYGGNIDEVKWSKDDSVPPYIIDEIRIEMAKQEEKIKEKESLQN